MKQKDSVILTINHLKGPDHWARLGGGSTPLGTTRGVDHRTSLRSMSVLEEKKSAKVCCLFNNNKVQSFTVSAADHQALSAIETPGNLSKPFSLLITFN